MSKKSLSDLSNKDRLAILTLARKKIAKGLAKNAFILRSHTEGNPSDHDKFCIHGACNIAASELGFRPKGRASGYITAGKLSLVEFAHRQGIHHLVKFNDAPATTKKDVLALIDGKIAEVKQEIKAS